MRLPKIGEVWMHGREPNKVISLEMYHPGGNPTLKKMLYVGYVVTSERYPREYEEDIHAFLLRRTPPEENDVDKNDLRDRLEKRIRVCTDSIEADYAKRALLHDACCMLDMLDRSVMSNLVRNTMHKNIDKDHPIERILRKAVLEVVEWIEENA